MADELVNELRQRLLADQGSFPEFDELDIERVRKDNVYLRRFILHRGGTVDGAHEMLVKCLKWRKNFGVNDLTEATIGTRYFEMGLGYIHNRDRKGNPILILNVQKRKKDSQTLLEFKKYVVYSLEKQERAVPGGKVTVLFDMTGTGLGNMDLEFLRFFIDCFKFYFPNMLELLLVFNMPWILQAVWKIVRSWLSEDARNLIKFVNKIDILEFIDIGNLLTRFGGTDTWEYHYYPSDDNGVSSKRVRFDVSDQEISEIIDDADASTVVDDGDDGDDKSRQAVSESESESQEVQPVDLVEREQKNANVHRQRQVTKLLQSQSPSPSPVKGVANRLGQKSKKSMPSETSVINWLKLSPSDELEFVGTHKENTRTVLHLTNVTEFTLGFKVKTTAPEHYSVKNSFGIVKSGETADVNITLYPGHRTLKDKFLVMCTQMENDLHKSVDQLNALWKSIDRSQVQEQRLPCRLVDKPSSKSRGDAHDVPASSHNDSLVQQLTELENSIKALKKQVDGLADENRQVLNQLERALPLQQNLFLATLFMVFIVLAIVLRLGQFDAWS